jgi:hypothetical protein
MPAPREVSSLESRYSASLLVLLVYACNAIRGAFRDILPWVQGMPVYDTGRVSSKINELSEYFGNSGINRWVHAAVNVAMWDAWTSQLKWLKVFAF